jgi:transcriptional regulator with XRE-family HTH domain
VANEFNGRYWGKSITPHTARNWLIGKSIPTQDKLRVLSDWLHISPDVLRFGMEPKAAKGRDAWIAAEVDLVDRELIERYLALDARDRKTVRDVVTALGLASTVRQPEVPKNGKPGQREPLKF